MSEVIRESSNSRLVGEQLLRPAEVPVLVARLLGVKVTTATVRGWMGRGLSGFRLESRRIGGQRVTSRQAVERFFASLGQL